MGYTLSFFSCFLFTIFLACVDPHIIKKRQFEEVGSEFGLHDRQTPFRQFEEVGSDFRNPNRQFPFRQFEEGSEIRHPNRQFPFRRFPYYQPPIKIVIQPFPGPFQQTAPFEHLNYRNPKTSTEKPLVLDFGLDRNYLLREIIKSHIGQEAANDPHNPGRKRRSIVRNNFCPSIMEEEKAVHSYCANNIISKIELGLKRKYSAFEMLNSIYSLFEGHNPIDSPKGENSIRSTWWFQSAAKLCDSEILKRLEDGLEHKDSAQEIFSDIRPVLPYHKEFRNCSDEGTELVTGIVEHKD